MSQTRQISVEHFKKRLTDLCLRSGLVGFPKSRKDQQILFKSAVLLLKKDEDYTEKEVDEKLKYWLDNICQIEKYDYITLRRMLVDSGYLERNREGFVYQVTNNTSKISLFAEKIEGLDIQGIIEYGREEIARKKREYLQRKNDQG